MKPTAERSFSGIEIAAGDAEKLARAALALAGGEGGKRSLAQVYSALR